MNVEQLLTLLMAELPAGVYPSDRADATDPNKNSNSSAELRTNAQMFADLYANLLDINENKFISTIQPDGLSPWEKDLFSTAQNSSLSFLARQSNLLAKYRAFGGISLPAIQALVSGLLTPLGLSFAILPWSGQNNGTGYGAWILDYSQLGFDTYLALLDPLFGAQQNFVPLDCNLDYAAAGITLQQLQDIQATAYTYEVDIYGNADANTLTQLDILLTQREPARSTHVIVNNAAPPANPAFVDFGAPGSNTLIDSIDFGNGGPAATYDVWDFAV